MDLQVRGEAISFSIFQALEVGNVALEVQQLSGIVRAAAILSTDGFNLALETKLSDNLATVPARLLWAETNFIDLDTNLSIFETGIKVVDALAIYVQSSNIGLFGGAGVGKAVFIMDLVNGFDDLADKLNVEMCDSGVSALFGRLPSAVEINVRPRFGMNWWPVQKIVWWSVPLCGSMGLELCYGLFFLLIYCFSIVFMMQQQTALVFLQIEYWATTYSNYPCFVRFYHFAGLIAVFGGSQCVDLRICMNWRPVQKIVWGSLRRSPRRMT